MRPFFFFCDPFVALLDGRSTGISSSVAGGVERSESEADMLLRLWCGRQASRCGGRKCPRHKHGSRDRNNE